jgi:starvation-inducible DNA-binding protein
MNNRLIAFIIMVVLATLTAFAQQDQLISVRERVLQEPSAMEESRPVMVSATERTLSEQDGDEPSIIQDARPVMVSVTERELSEPTMNEEPKSVIVSEAVRELTMPAPPIMEEPQPISAPVVLPMVTNGNGVNIGLSADVRQKEASMLNKLLADEFVLYTKTLKFHWNVQGIVFHDFHIAFKEQYEKLFEIVDLIAERARALGAPALGSLQEFTTYTRLKEITTEKLSALEMIKALLVDHEAIIRTIREAIDTTAQLGDQGTSNFLQDLIVKHEKIAWMLRATAQN